jgi:uncharacterized protein YdhG (YjbR/CyaY superfamily)
MRLGPRETTSLKTKPETIDQYLSALTEAERTALTKLRKAIHAAAPGLEECISYSMPAFRFEGSVVAGFAANRNFLSYYPFSGSVLKTLERDIEGYDRTKGALRFPAEKPLPAGLVRKLVEARIEEERR